MEQIWFFSDEFADTSFLQNFKHVKGTDDYPIYTSKFYEVLGNTTNRYVSSLRNILSRVVVLVGKAIKENTILPKALVFVMDDDIIKQVKIDSNYMEEEYAEIITFLLKETERLVSDYKGKLPLRSKREYYPHMIWMVPPTHHYFANKK